MGFLYTSYGPVEAGFDGIIELRDRTTGHVGGRLVAVQVKTRSDGTYAVKLTKLWNNLSRTGASSGCGADN
jgi:hypothetical protein